MEDSTQGAADSGDVADEPGENQSENANSAPVATTSDFVAQETGSSSENKSESAERPTARRNYRRHTEGSDESDADAAVEPANFHVPTPSDTESEDVSLDELRVDRSDDDNNQNGRR